MQMSSKKKSKKYFNCLKKYAKTNKIENADTSLQPEPSSPSSSSSGISETEIEMKEEPSTSTQVGVAVQTTCSCTTSDEVLKVQLQIPNMTLCVTQYLNQDPRTQHLEPWAKPKFGLSEEEIQAIRMLPAKNVEPGDPTVHRTNFYKPYCSESLCSAYSPNINEAMYHYFFVHHSQNGILCCNSVWRKHDLFRQHCLDVHDYTPMYHLVFPCIIKECKSKFCDIYDLIAHYLLCHKNLSMECCTTYIDSYKAYADHNIKFPNGPHLPYTRWPCRVCCKFFVSPEVLEHHLSMHVTGSVSCLIDTCAGVFQSQRLALFHLYLDHGEMKTGRLECCGLIYTDFFDFINHLNAFPSDEHAPRHLYYCDICGTHIVRSNEFMSHRNTHEQFHIKTGSKPTPIIPCECGYQGLLCPFQKTELLRILPNMLVTLTQIITNEDYSFEDKRVAREMRSTLTLLHALFRGILCPTVVYNERHTKPTDIQLSEILVTLMQYHTTIVSRDKTDAPTETVPAVQQQS